MPRYKGKIAGVVVVLTLCAWRTAKAVPVFQDGFESGTSNWILQVPWGRTTSSALSGTFSLTDSPGGNYSNFVNASATMASGFSLVGATPAAVVTFWHRYFLEASYDFGYVEVSTNGGASWSQVGTSYTGTNSTWTQVSRSLAPYVGQPDVRLRLRLTTDNIVTADGWYIDDVVVDNGVFPVTVTNPNGGEVWMGGATRNVTWTYDGSLAGAASFRLDYSTDGGVTYPNAIASGLAIGTTTYSWTTPAINSSSVRVRVQVLDSLTAVLASDASNANFTIDSTPPGPVTLVNPTNGACAGPTPTFDWSDSTGAATYALTITPAAGPTFTKSGLTASGYTLTAVEALGAAGNPHSWSVTASDAAGNSTSSSSWSFTVDPVGPTAFDLTGPGNNSWQKSSGLTFTWNAATDSGCGLARYRLYVDSSLCKDNIPPGTTAATLSSLTCTLAEGPHQWRVAAVDNAGNVTWCNQAPGGVGGWTVNLDNLGPGVVAAALRDLYPNSIAPSLMVNTGVTVSAGQVLDFSASGTWCFENGGNCNSFYCYGPGGDSGNLSDPRPATNCYFGMLIARIGGAGSYLCVGSGLTVTASASGTLYLGANDDDTLNCTTRYVSATITVWGTAWNLLAPASNALLGTGPDPIPWTPRLTRSVS